ncbi:MAG: hypothetical protein ACRENO_02715, partial [Thermodesulfobacteriota bacterium]
MKINTYKTKLILILILIIITIFFLSLFLLSNNKEKTNDINVIKKNKINNEKKLKEEKVKTENKNFETLKSKEVKRIITENDNTKIDLLKENFKQATNIEDKSLYASILIRFDAPDKEVYQNYLVEVAERVINDDRPFPLKLDESGNAIRGELSPEFIEWCEKNNISIKPANECFNEYFYKYPALIGYFALTDDELFIEYVEKGIKSKNIFVVSASSTALAVFGDRRYIELIRETLESQNNPQYSEIIALSLLYFNDPYA